MQGAALPPRRMPGGRLFVYALAATIILGCLVMWLGIPLVSLWIVSQLTRDSATFLMLLLAVCPLLMGLFAIMLVRLNAIYVQATGGDQSQMRAAWLNSLSGERAPRRAPPAVLEKSMVFSVVLAIVLMLVFFFFFAENYSPAPIAP